MGIIDPRAEPESLPPKSEEQAPSSSSPPASKSVSTRPKETSEPEKARETSEPPKPLSARAKETSEPPSPASDAPKSRVITNTDPRLEAIEPFLNRGDWAGIVKELGPPEKAGALPPHLGLIFALAMSETAGAESPTDAAQLAIRCAAGLFGVSADSATALVMAKRLLRKNPLSFGKRPAPAARTSALIVLVTLVFGAGVGWLLTGGAASFRHFFR